jgi:peptidoglycan/LPS O-acetylase OafA/YrhL
MTVTTAHGSNPPLAIAPAAAVTKPMEFNVAAHGLRGVAAMMVFIAHLLGGTAEHIYAADRGYTDAIRPFWNIGTFGVELFFVISGFVILPSVMRYSLSEFALRRLLRLYPLFLAFSLLFIVLNAVTAAYPKLNSPLAVFSGLAFVNLFTGTEQLTPNAWSLSFEVMFYAAMAVTWHYAVTRRNLVMAMAMIALSLAFLAAFPIVVFFLMGLIIRVAHDRGAFLPPRFAQAAEIGVFAQMLWLASISHSAYAWSDFAKPSVPPLIVCTGLFFYLAIHPASLTSRLLANRATLYLGTVSYSLYIVHPYIYLPMRLLFDRLGWFTADHVTSMAGFVAAVTPLVLVATAFVHKHLEIRPYAWFFKQNVYRRRAAKRSTDDQRG